MIKPYYEEPGITIYNADCLDVLPQLEPVDLVLTDPPYNVGFSYGEYKDDLSEDDYLKFISLVWEMCAERGALSIVWFWQGIRVANGEARACLPKGFRVHHLAAWFKKEFAGDLWKGGHPAYCWEPIIWAAKGDVVFSGPKGGHAGRDALIGISSRHDIEAKGHPCNKTFKIVKSVASWTSGTILDPFMGSGTTLRAAKDLGRKAIGIEIEKKYCDIAIERLRQGVLI